MSIGLAFIRSCCEAGGHTEFRHALPIWFTEPEQNAYQFVYRHLSRHGRLPSVDTLHEQGITTPVANEPPAYYVDQLTDRAISAQIRQHHPALLQAMSNMDMAMARVAIRAMDTAATSVAPNTGMSSFIDQALLVEEQYNRARRNHRLIGVTLGYEILDRLTDGGQPGDVIVLVGRPGLGKTYTMLHMLLQAWRAGSSIFIASMEMHGTPLARRMLGMQGLLNPSHIRSGRLSSFGHHTFLNTIRSLEDMPPFHIMTGDFRKNVSDIDKAVQETSPDIIAVDAGYLLTPDKRRGQNRRELISDVIEQLKQVASDRQRPLMTTVQFNREVKRKQRGVPELGNIAETDVIAQVATVVLGMQYGSAPMERTKRQITVMKNRDGEDNVSFEINYALDPPNFDFLRVVEDTDDAENAPAQNLEHLV